MSNKHTFPGGTLLHKELQGFAAFVAYQGCHQGGTSVTKALLEASVADQFFGDPNNPDSIGLAEQLVRGVGVFSSLYERRAVSHSPSPTHECHQRITSLVLKPSLRCLGQQITIPVGGANGITLPLLLQSKLAATNKKTSTSNNLQDSHDRIKARTLFTRAQEVAKNGKKALACVMSQDSPYREYVRTGNLPSGMNHGDYLQFVRDKMYIALNSSKVDSSDDFVAADDVGDDGNDDDVLTSRVRDDGRKNGIFPGYIVFALMGPIVEDFDMLRHRSDLLMTSTPLYSSSAEKKLAGRQNGRKEKSDEANQKRRNSDDDGSSKVTSSFAASREHETSVASRIECLQAAAIAQSRLADRGKKKTKVNDRIVSMHRTKVAGKRSIIEEQKFLINATTDDPQARALYLQELRQLNLELSIAMDDLAKAEERIIKDEGNDVTNIDSVGIMIDATIAGILEKKIESRVSPMPPFVATYDNDENGDDVDCEIESLL